MFGRRFLGVIGPFFTVFLSTAGLASSWQAGGEATLSGERTLMAETFATEKLWKWQKRLRLEDWSINVRMARTSELKPKTLGNIHWDVSRKTAVIRVLDPADYRMPLEEMLEDMEFTVVHELIHLKIAPAVSGVTRNEASRREEEYAVNHIADALLGR